MAAGTREPGAALLAVINKYSATSVKRIEFVVKA